MTKRQRRSPEVKAQALHDAAATGDRIARLVEDEWFQRWFAALERRLTVQMVANVADVQAMQTAGMRLEAVLALKQDLMVEAEKGRQARKALEKAVRSDE